MIDLAMNKSGNSDQSLRNLDSADEARFLLTESSRAEKLFAQYFLDLDLIPYQEFVLKFMRGAFRTEGEVLRFIEDNNLHFLRDTGRIRLCVYKNGQIAPNNEIMLPGGMGKTTLVRVFCDMEAADNPNSRNQLIFKNKEEGHSLTGVVRGDLEMPKMTDLFGTFKTGEKSWSNDRFTVSQRQVPDIRDNFEVYSTNSDAALGKRSDRVISDDVETPDTARTTDACEKLVEWFLVGPMTSPKPLWAKSKTGVKIPQHIRWPNRLYWGHTNLGTIFHPRGLHAFCENNPEYNTVVFDCFKDRKQSVSLDERMMSIDELHAKRRSVGVLAFNKRYRNIALDPAEMNFQEQWVRGGDYIADSGKRLTYEGCLDEKRSYGEVREGEELYLGFDPATGSTTRFAAYSGYVLVAKVPEEDAISIVDYLKIQCDYSRQIDHLLGGNEKYGIDGFVGKYSIRQVTLEKNNHGMYYTGDDRVKPFIQNGLIKPSYTGSNKLDPVIGIPSLAGVVESGHLRIPYQTTADQNKSETFITDLIEFHPIRDKRDLVMALWLACIPLTSARGKYRSFYRRGGGGRIVHRR